MSTRNRAVGFAGNSDKMEALGLVMRLTSEINRKVAAWKEGDPVPTIDLMIEPTDPSAIVDIYSILADFPVDQIE